ncbi:hypothetical protein [Streptomyces sp. NPDC005017]|uniref:hypothetical protein n=1 Tax=Streptomyces sp. NPDC005017 TaxID=3364706 RepID=UPI0036C3EF45
MYEQRPADFAAVRRFTGLTGPQQDDIVAARERDITVSGRLDVGRSSLPRTTEPPHIAR